MDSSLAHVVIRVDCESKGRCVAVEYGIRICLLFRNFQKPSGILDPDLFANSDFLDTNGLMDPELTASPYFSGSRWNLGPGFVSDSGFFRIPVESGTRICP